MDELRQLRAGDNYRSSVLTARATPFRTAAREQGAWGAVRNDLMGMAPIPDDIMGYLGLAAAPALLPAISAIKPTLPWKMASGAVTGALEHPAATVAGMAPFGGYAGARELAYAKLPPEVLAVLRAYSPLHQGKTWTRVPPRIAEWMQEDWMQGLKEDRGIEYGNMSPNVKEVLARLRATAPELARRASRPDFTYRNVITSSNAGFRTVNRAFHNIDPEAPPEVIDFYKFYEGADTPVPARKLAAALLKALPSVRVRRAGAPNSRRNYFQALDNAALRQLSEADLSAVTGGSGVFPLLQTLFAKTAGSYPIHWKLPPTAAKPDITSALKGLRKSS